MFHRDTATQHVLVALNFTAEPRKIDAPPGKILMSTNFDRIGAVSRGQPRARTERGRYSRRLLMNCDVRRRPLPLTNQTARKIARRDSSLRVSQTRASAQNDTDGERAKTDAISDARDRYPLRVFAPKVLTGRCGRIFLFSSPTPGAGVAPAGGAGREPRIRLPPPSRLRTDGAVRRIAAMHKPRNFDLLATELGDSESFGLALARGRRAFQPEHVEPKWARDRAADIKHIKLEVALDFDAKQISGTATHRLSAIASPLERLEFDATELEIRSGSCEWRGSRVRDRRRQAAHHAAARSESRRGGRTRDRIRGPSAARTLFRRS